MSRNPKEIAAALYDACVLEEAGDPLSTAQKAAYYLFAELARRVGPARAKYVFRHYGKSLTQSDQNDRKNYAVLDRLDAMTDDNGKPCPVYLRLAKILAPENMDFPRAEQKGPGGVEVTALAKHIENLVKRRERELEAGTWFGPITREQAIRHFGTGNVATSD